MVENAQPINDFEHLALLEKKDILKFLAMRHPWWKTNSSAWDTYADFRRGEVTPEDYLIHGAIESDDDFRARCELAIFTPEAPRIVDHIMGFLRRNETNREKIDAKAKAVVDSADKYRRPLGLFTLTALESALYMGAQYILVDRAKPPKDAEGNPILPKSELENERLGSPYCVLYGPRNLVNWEVGEDGALNWASIREESTKQSSPDDPKITLIVYRLFSRTSSAVITISPRRRQGDKSTEFKADESSPENVDITFDLGIHDLGVVPIKPVLPFPHTATAVVQGMPFIEPAVKRDVSIYRMESDLQWNHYLHLHPQLVIESNDTGVFIAFKANSAIRLAPGEGEKAYYIGPPEGIFQQSREMIRESRDECWVATGQEAASRISQDRIREQSGVHKRLSFEMAEGAILSYLSDIIVDVERGILEIVARYFNPADNPGPGENVFTGEITRKKTYDLFWIGDFIEQLEKAKSYVQNSPSFMNRAIRRIATAMLDNPEQEIIDQIAEELENSKSFLSDHIPTLLDELQILKDVSCPSEEMVKQFFRRIAELAFPGEENADVLQQIIDEIEESEIDMDKVEENLNERFKSEAAGDNA